MPVTINRGLIGALNVDWARQRLIPAVSTIRTWQAEPALAQFGSLVEVEAAAAKVGDNDATLAALLRLAQAGDRLAARLLLQVLLGAAVRLASRTVHHAGGDLEEARSRAVEALWQCIHRYPADRRHGRHADQITLDALAILVGRTCGRTAGAVREYPAGVFTDTGWSTDHKWDPIAGYPADLFVRNYGELVRGTPTHPMERHPGLQDDLDSAARDQFWAANDTQAPACSDQELIQLLAWAVREQVIHLHEAQILLRRYCSDEPGRQPTAFEVARELGITSAALRQRTSRIVQRLTTAVRSANPQTAHGTTTWTPTNLPATTDPDNAQLVAA